jgi:hypothetical protein
MAENDESCLTTPNTTQLLNEEAILTSSPERPPCLPLSNKNSTQPVDPITPVKPLSHRVLKASRKSPTPLQLRIPSPKQSPSKSLFSPTESECLYLNGKSCLSPNSTEEGPLLHWEPEELLKLRSWITCSCLVDFDLALGQTMKFAYPSGVLSEAEGQNVALLAFPDSHSKAVGEYNFCFRFRTSPSSSTSKSDMKYPYLFGYVYFCQKPDSSLHRGYFQKSIVLVSHLPYTELFLRVVKIIGPLFFSYGYSILEAFFRNISQWPCPTKVGKFTLPVLGERVQVNIQPHNTPPFSSPSQATESSRKSQLTYPNEQTPTVWQVEPSMRRNFTQMLVMGFCAEMVVKALKKSNNNLVEAIGTARAELKEALKKEGRHRGIDLTDLYSPTDTSRCCGVFQEINIYEVFQKVLGNLWFLWECALAGEPVMVISQSPEVCTRAVLGIMSLIAPVIYGGDYRPYFTIYDPDFKHYQELHDHGTLGSVILGVTNPFFLKAYPKWTNVLYLSTVDEEESNPSPDSYRGYRLSTLYSRRRSKKYRHIVKKTLDQEELIFEGNPSKMVSRHLGCIDPDEKTLRLLLERESKCSPSLEKRTEAKEQIAAINNSILRKHFFSMTSNFLRSFRIYFTFNSKQLKSPLFNPYLTPVSLLPWDEKEFLEEIQRAPKAYFKDLPPKLSRSSLVKLYSKFFKSPHFHPWFHKKRDLGQAKLRRAVHKVIKRINFPQLLRGESVKNGKKMYREILRMLKVNQDNPEIKHTLNYHLKIVKDALPINNLLESRCKTYLTISSEYHAFQRPKDDQTSKTGFQRATI